MADSPATSTMSGQPGAADYESWYYEEQKARWQFCRDMDRGTEALREDPEYLIQSPAETDTEFEARVKRSELFPMFKETVTGLTGLVFANDPLLGDDVPKSIVPLWENIDNAGTAGPVFMREAFEDALTVGHCGVLVDVAQNPNPDGKPPSIAQAQRLGLRPYCVHYKAEQIINHRLGTVNGVTVLTLLVLREQIAEEQGDFGSEIVTRYRVYRRDLVTGVITWHIFREADHPNPPVLDIEGVLQNAIAIPFAVIYGGKRRAPLVSFPPLIELAYTNVAHAQVSSDRRTSLHYASSPILVFIGREQAPGDPDRPPIDTTELDPNDPATAQIIAGLNEDRAPVGPNFGIDVPIGGNVKYAEHAGKALEASDKELGNLERRAAAQGFAILDTGNKQAETAEAKHLDASQRDASLMRAVRSCQDAGEQLLAFMAMFLGERTGGSMEISRDFQNVLLDSATFTQLSKSTLAGQISLPTFWKILKNGVRRGQILPDDFDPVEELRILKEQAEGMTGANEQLALSAGNPNPDADPNADPNAEPDDPTDDPESEPPAQPTAKPGDTPPAKPGTPPSGPSKGGSGDVMPTQGGPSALQGLPADKSVEPKLVDDETGPGRDPALTGGSLGQNGEV